MAVNFFPFFLGKANMRYIYIYICVCVCVCTRLCMFKVGIDRSSSVQNDYL